MVTDAEQLEPTAAEGPADQSAPERHATPIESRFLYVDIAAQRAKQLRRGALPRLPGRCEAPSPHKLERIAMEEVKQGVIDYTLPNYPRRRGDGE